MKNIVVLGSTGSVGRQALEVIKNSAGLNAVGLSANSNAELFKSQVQEFSPKYCFLASNPDTKFSNVESLSSNEDLAVLKEADIVLAAISGMDGLSPLIAALKAGKTVALASKEALVSGGWLLKDLEKKSNGNIIPVDSEHSAIFQCLLASGENKIKRILLTASGGAFRDFDKSALKTVTPEQALAHPVWAMGKKVTVDSASLMNKGLELLEAMYLFDVPPEKIEIVIHRESIIHSMVEFEDGAVIAMLSSPDMRLALNYAFTHPKRTPGLTPSLDFKTLKSLSFDSPDFEKFPCLRLAADAAKSAYHQKTAAGAVLAAADEIAVERFLKKEIGFEDIYTLNAKCLEKFGSAKIESFDDVHEIIKETTEYAKGLSLN